MEHCIRILDYLEENEENWMETSENFKNLVFDGLGEIANFRLTQDTDVNISNLVSDKAATVVDDEWKVAFHCKNLQNSYLVKARAKFMNSLNVSIQLVKLKIGLFQILNE